MGKKADWQQTTALRTLTIDEHEVAMAESFGCPKTRRGWHVEMAVLGSW